MIQNGILSVLKKHSVIPVVTLNSEKDVHDVAEKLKAANIHCAEITLRTDYALEGIAKMLQTYPAIEVGVGTVIATKQIQALKALNVAFMVSPGASALLVSAMQASGIPFLPGVVTPSEIIQGIEQGLAVFKFFPANIFGGINTLKGYGQVFPSCTFCPTGGLTAENFEDFLALENVISVGGSWMLK